MVADFHKCYLTKMARLPNSTQRTKFSVGLVIYTSLCVMVDSSFIVEPCHPGLGVLKECACTRQSNNSYGTVNCPLGNSSYEQLPVFGKTYMGVKTLKINGGEIGEIPAKAFAAIKVGPRFDLLLLKGQMHHQNDLGSK